MLSGRRPAWRISVLWTLIVLLVIFWILGLAFKVAAGAIHILLVIALVLFIVQLVSGRRTSV
jgi:4-hydroxybenzoate polyprenyltransferase